MKVGFVQINNSFSGQSYLPYSVGLIQAHLDANSKFNKDFDFALPIYWRIKVDDAVERPFTGRFRLELLWWRFILHGLAAKIRPTLALLPLPTPSRAVRTRPTVRQSLDVRP